jgi:NADH:ubiquinone oxidoreductase subunit C
MSIEQKLQTAEQLLAPWNKETIRPEENRLDVVIQPEALHEAASALHDAKWGYLSAITGMDMGVEAGQLEALYHFCNGPAITSLRVRLPRAECGGSKHCRHHPACDIFRARDQGNVWHQSGWIGCYGSSLPA